MRTHNDADTEARNDHPHQDAEGHGIDDVGGNTVMDYMQQWRARTPHQVWLRDRKDGAFTDWSWQQAWEEFQPIAAWLEQDFADSGTSIAILSKNRAHWTLADMAILASGHVSIPLFTTLVPDTVEYVLEFTQSKLLVLGEASNWDAIKPRLPKGMRVLVLPGVNADTDGLDVVHWADILARYKNQQARHQCTPDELFTIPFTSGTTGLPKGVMQTHQSMLIPIERACSLFNTRENPRFLSYLPLAHIAERAVVWIHSLICGGTITFNEDLSTLVRDMAETKPSYFFGAPRVWELLRQGVIAKFGSQESLDQALASDRDATQRKVQQALGLADTDYLLSAAAPTPSSLIDWYEKLGIVVCEGYGQTEANALIGNRPDARRIGSIGQAVEGVDVRISEDGELMCRAEGLSPGYYKQPDKTAETFVDGWVKTGDKARVDDDGYYYITGRVKDYFKTLHGKYVAPPPIEDAFAEHADVEQLCLLGRGYAKTAMVCVLSPAAHEKPASAVVASLRAQAEKLNAQVEKHARSVEMKLKAQACGGLVLLFAVHCVARRISSVKIRIAERLHKPPEWQPGAR